VDAIRSATGANVDIERTRIPRRKALFIGAPLAIAEAVRQSLNYVVQELSRHQGGLPRDPKNVTFRLLLSKQDIRLIQTTPEVVLSPSASDVGDNDAGTSNSEDRNTSYVAGPKGPESATVRVRPSSLSAKQTSHVELSADGLKNLLRIPGMTDVNITLTPVPGMEDRYLVTFLGSPEAIGAATGQITQILHQESSGDYVADK
jgi:hypothetical protein